jgi:hypothetical protein
MEFDQRGGLGRVVDFGVDRVRVPAIGEVAFGLDLFDLQLQRQVVVARDGEPAPDGRAGGKGALELYAELGAEFGRGRDGAPHAGARGVKLDALFDAVGSLLLIGLGRHTSLLLL